MGETLETQERGNPNPNPSSVMEVLVDNPNPNPRNFAERSEASPEE
jgi:hypothetical protein